MMAAKKVLVVDDEVGFARLLKLNLEGTGKFEVQTENKGSQAVHTARSFKPDLILLDIIMPDMDGSEVANRLKNDPVTRNTPILFLTALVKDKELQTTSGEIGGHIFLAKPITTDELVHSIDRALSDEPAKSQQKLP
jgi:CheY-like chemotaxis protein